VSWLLAVFFVSPPKLKLPWLLVVNAKPFFASPPNRSSLDSWFLILFLLPFCNLFIPYSFAGPKILNFAHWKLWAKKVFY
jgi:hypothetical protein